VINEGAKWLNKDFCNKLKFAKSSAFHLYLFMNIIPKLWLFFFIYEGFIFFSLY
jgi:hypothetical protein